MDAGTAVGSVATTAASSEAHAAKPSGVATPSAAAYRRNCRRLHSDRLFTHVTVLPPVTTPRGCPFTAASSGIGTNPRFALCKKPWRVSVATSCQSHLSRTTPSAAICSMMSGKVGWKAATKSSAVAI